jgi:lambda family phage minor tail protein L
MSISSEIQSLAPSALIELFTIDTSALGGDVFHFHAGTNALLQQVVWQGISHTPLPIEAEGFELTTKGSLPRPKIRVANVGGIFSALSMEMGDLVGAKVTRKRTFARYLDAVNFPDGNVTADPNQFLPEELWFVEVKATESRHVIEWELSSAFDLMGVMLPSRQVVQNSCSWRYRSAECSYIGPNFDRNDQPSTLALDFCTKRLSSCRARFGTEVIPFGGFPGSVRYG